MAPNEIKIRRRRLFIKLALAALWIALCVLLFTVNRGHTLLMDNHDVEVPQLGAPDLIRVTVDKGKSSEFFRNDRDLFKVRGSRHRITVEFSDGNQPFETEFTLPIGPDMFIVSIPKMINGVEPFFEVFHSQPETRSDEVEVELEE